MSTTMTEDNRKPHDGRNIKRIREILQMKQSTLATALGEDWNQKKISQLEQKETIDDALMEEIADALKVPVEAIRNFDEKAAITIISSTLHDQAGSVNYNPVFSFNPIDKIVELYEQLVNSEKEKVQMLQKMLEGKA